jgi:hypothetical protein
VNEVRQPEFLATGDDGEGAPIGGGIAVHVGEGTLEAALDHRIAVAEG